MNTSRVRWKLMALIAGILIVIALIVFFIIHRNTAPTGDTNNATNTGNASATVVTTVTGITLKGSTTTPPPSGGAKGNIPALPGPAITIHLITPLSGNAWTIGGANPIAWDNPANITGEIELVNVNTKTFIGVILLETGPNQTSYSWNARSIYLSRYGANEKDVVPGTYSIRIHFDGNGLGDLVSGPITITN